MDSASLLANYGSKLPASKFIISLMLLLASCVPASTLTSEADQTPTAVIAGETATQLPAEFEPTPRPTIEPFRFVLPTPGAEPVSGWRPPLYPVPWAVSAYDHFYLPGPSPRITSIGPWRNIAMVASSLRPNIVHTGVDIDAEEVTSILAAGPGTVVSSGWGLFSGASNIDRTPHSSGAYLPFAVEEGEDVPPFLPIGGTTPVRQTSSTHGPDGYITTDPVQIQAQVERLQRKIEGNVESFTYFDLDRKENTETLIITYGVTARAARDAVAALDCQGALAPSLLVLKTLWPVPEHILRSAAEDVERILVVEMNLGQYVHEVRRVLCHKKVDFHGKMCGRLILPLEILREE